jgi:hypothetical protein
MGAAAIDGDAAITAGDTIAAAEASRTQRPLAKELRGRCAGPILKHRLDVVLVQEDR